MIIISAKFAGEKLVALSAEGHSGSAAKGSDVVCAAVSVLMQTLAVGFIDVYSLDNIEHSSDDAVPVISYAWKSDDPGVDALGRTIYLSLKAVERSAPDFVKVLEEVVS